jgi:molecular chaperone DnaK (HSP70)
MTEPLAALVKAYIGIDLGSANSAVVYSIETTTSTVKVRVCKDSILPRLRVVAFPDLDMQAATLVSYGKSCGDDAEGRFLFGSEVADALEQGTIVPGQIIRWLKIALFDPSPYGLVMKQKIEQKISRLPVEARSVTVADGTSREINCHDLLSMYLGCLWRSTLRHMKGKENCSMPWPDLPHQDQYRGVDTADVQFEIAIAVPALATPQQCDMVSEAARLAGLATPFLFSEPSVAAYYLLQRDFEYGNPPTSEVVLVVDIGAGTAVWPLLTIGLYRMLILLSGFADI